MKKSISGIRGIIGDDLTLKDILKFCNNFSTLIKTKKCVIGNDTRPSANMLKQTAIASLLQNGIDVFNLDMSPAPVVFRETRNYGGGLMITASHNPIEWNGVKFIVDGRIINDEELEVVLNDQSLPKSKIGNETKIVTNYVDEAVKLIGIINNSPKVVVDIGGGAAKLVAPAVLRKIGCKTQIINEEITSSTRGPDPTSDQLSDLTAISKKNDIGFAFDLDGDRLILVKDGKKQSPDLTLGLGIAKAIELGYKKFVLSLDTSVSVEKFIKENRCQVQKSKVGEANVIDLILKSKAQAGGEGSSGGFILPEFNYCRDGILTSGLIASMIGTKTFDYVLTLMKKSHMLRDKLEVDSEFHDKIIELLLDRMESEFSEISTLDGIKGKIDNDSWVLVRKSNTEDSIRISAEADSSEKCKKILQQTKDLVKQSYEQVK
ncbi:MAG: Phosphoglucomutase/phosphomannomutase subunit alpha/beta [Nitrosopumilales archaeon]|nr:MAG: Phosphoglucomutase/phosphomannomutase subunit alpha/beta [Nitrosopumilales archaeon]